jgi:cytosine deaminase
VIDATGKLVAPPFVDAHFHMDATLSYGRPRVNASGTLLEGIALWGELKQEQSREDIVARALPIAARPWPRACSPSAAMST